MADESVDSSRSGVSGLDGIVDAIKALPETEAVLLAGSRGSNTADEYSDSDLYIYWTTEISAAVRLEIAREFCSAWELDNRYWETEDILELKDDGGKVELIYRDYDFVRGDLERSLIRHEAWVGYSSCIASNILNSSILYDRDDRFAALKEEFSAPYPRELAQNIILKNFSILAGSKSSYSRQVAVAVKRGDLISINHRIAAFIASYMDILFAVNGEYHPGEKKLLKLIRDRNLKAPHNFDKYFQTLLYSAGTADSQLSLTMELMSAHLGELVKSLGYKLPKARHDGDLYSSGEFDTPRDPAGSGEADSGSEEPDDSTDGPDVH